jgi:hypothetical protein
MAEGYVARRFTPDSCSQSDRRVCARAVLTLTLGAISFTSQAQAQANYEGALIGGRSSLMGGTGVANGTDASAPLQNPATILGIEGTSFVFSTLFVQRTDRQVSLGGQVVAENTKGADSVSDVAFNVLPNATCLFLDLVHKPGPPKGNQKLSFCILETETQNFRFQSRIRGEDVRDASGVQVRSVEQTFSKRVYAGTYALRLSDLIGVGVTPMLEEYAFKDQEGLATLVAQSESLSSAVGAQGHLATNALTENASAFALSALLGVQLYLPHSFRTGISLQLPGLPFGGSYAASSSTEATFGSEERLTLERGSAGFKTPMRLALGFAGRLGKVDFEVDGYFHAGGDYATAEGTRDATSLSSGEITEFKSGAFSRHERVHPVTNVGIGVNVPVSKEWALVSGFLTDFSGLDPRRTGQPVESTMFRSRIDMIHGSLGVAWTPRAGSVLLGVRGFYGEGELAVSGMRTFPTVLVTGEQTAWGLSLVLSGQLTLELLAAADPTGLVESVAKPSGTTPSSAKPSGTKP